MAKTSCRWRRRAAHLIGGLALSLLASTGVAQAGDVPPSVAPAPVAPRPLTLAECLDISLAQQPALAASQASVAAAEAQKRALDNLHAPPLTAASRELPIRRQQASLGITVAEAGLSLAKQETIYAVTRTYHSVIYARQQERVANRVVSELTDALENARRLVQGGARYVTKNDVDKTEAYLRLAESRQFDAQRGVAVALAALKEAMGVGPEFRLALATDELPTPSGQIAHDEMLSLALSHRAELTQAITFGEVTRLEIDTQGSSCLPLPHHTFASFVDLHVRPIPQGVSNSEYRPGAVGPEMPPMLVGNRADRVDRARILNERAGAVVDKTRNLITLEAEDAFLKWQNAVQKAAKNKIAAERGEKLAKDNLNDLKANLAVVYRDVLEAVVLGAQARVAYNEALFEYVNALASLERVTGGGFCAGLAAPVAPRPQ
jgi:outer membrane protein TolC